MDGYKRSKRSYSYSYDSSYGNGMMQIESYYGPPRPLPITAASTTTSSSSSSYELRSYSASYAQAQMDNSGGRNNKGRDFKLKKGKSISGSSSWGLNDPELQRRKRVASYKMYSVEGRVKGSLRKSFRWLKDKYTQVVYGWW